MKRIDTVLVLIALNLATIFALNTSTGNEIKVANNANEQTKKVAEEQSPAVVVISERTLGELEAAAKLKEKQNATKTVKVAQNVLLPKEISTLNGNKTAVNSENKIENAQAAGIPKAESKPANQNEEKPNPQPTPTTETILTDEVKYRMVLKDIDDDIQGSVRTGFYILMGISVGALLFVGIKINKMRLSRAERKYGVHGNRSNQELAPLPLSMEEPYSDDEDQTLFDVNRQQIRIF